MEGGKRKRERERGREGWRERERGEEQNQTAHQTQDRHKHLVCFIDHQLYAELQGAADLSILCIPLHQGVPSLIRLIGGDFPQRDHHSAEKVVRIGAVMIPYVHNQVTIEMD